MRRRLAVLVIGILVLVSAWTGTALARERVSPVGSQFDLRGLSTTYESEDSEGRSVYIDLTHIEGPSEADAH